MCRWKIIVLLVSFPVWLPAQTASFAFRTISINDGLSQSSVVDIAIDKAGFVWLATQDGLNRYDGKDFLVFPNNFDDITTSSGNRLGKLIRSGDNELWLISSGGQWERLDLRTQIFQPGAHNKIKQASAAISYLYPEKEKCWIGTEQDGVYIQNMTTGALMQLSTSSFPALSSNAIKQIFHDSRGTNWVLTDKGVTGISPDMKNSIYALNGAAGEAVACSAITEDSSGTLWLGSFGKGLFVKQKNDAGFQPFKGFGKAQALPGNLVIESMLTDNENRVWVGTYGQGLFIIDSRQSQVYHLLADKKDPFSLGYNDVLSIKQDRYGGIWIGTDGGGVSYYHKRLNNFKSLTRNNLPAGVAIEQVRAITTDKTGNIWAGTSNSGLTFISQNMAQSATVHLADPVSYERIVALYADPDNDLWIGTQGNGLLLANAGTRKVKKIFQAGSTGPHDFPDNTIWCFLPDKNGRVWAGTRHGGLCLVDKEKGVIKTYRQSAGPANRLAEDNIRSLARMSDSVIVIGFENSGVQFLNTNSGQLLLLQESIFRQLFNGNTMIRTLYYAAPVLWIGTYGKGLKGVNLLNGNILEAMEKNGLANNTVYGIQPERNGALWLSTNKGICRFLPPPAGQAIDRSCFNTFTAEDGLQSNEFNTGAHYRSADGRLFFGGINGLSIVDPSAITNSYEQGPVLITEALVDNQPLESDTLIMYKKKLELSHRQNSISFSFAAPDMIAAGHINYYYQLLGYDDDWVDADERNYVAYTNLRPGKYILRVKAGRDSNAANQVVTTLDILIRPPFWKTWWFIGACILLLLGLLYALYRYRISQLLHLQKVRNRIASDLHDDIGSTLTNISILSELSRKNLQEGEDPAIFLDRISEEVQRSGQALDDIVWSINTDNDTLEQTVARMRRYAAELFDAAGIDYTLRFDEKFAQRKLNMEQRRDFLLLFKETLNNIYKHARAKNVAISTGIENSRLFMRITDDGTGFDSSLPSTRNGIKNMRERAEKWKGSIEIDTAPGKGSSLAFSFPVA